MARKSVKLSLIADLGRINKSGNVDNRDKLCSLESSKVPGECASPGGWYKIVWQKANSVVHSLSLGTRDPLQSFVNIWGPSWSHVREELDRDRVAVDQRTSRLRGPVWIAFSAYRFGYRFLYDHEDFCHRKECQFARGVNMEERSQQMSQGRGSALQNVLELAWVCASWATARKKEGETIIGSEREKERDWHI